MCGVGRADLLILLCLLPEFCQYSWYAVGFFNCMVTPVAGTVATYHCQTDL